MCTWFLPPTSWASGSSRNCRPCSDFQWNLTQVSVPLLLSKEKVWTPNPSWWR